MDLFNKLKAIIIGLRFNEERIYLEVAKEMAAGVRRDGLWLKAMEGASGNAEAATSLYIKYRVQAYRDEAKLLDLADELAKTQKRIARATTDIVSVGCAVDILSDGKWEITKTNGKDIGRKWIANNIDELEKFAEAARER